MSGPRLRPLNRDALVRVEDRSVHLFGLLDGVRRLRSAQWGLAWLLWSAAGLLASLLVLVLGDAVAGFSTPVRVALLGVGIASVVGAVLAGVMTLLRSRADAQQAARIVECRLNLGDSVLINAVQFLQGALREESPQLRQRVVELAEERARGMSSLSVLPWRGVGRAASAAAGVTVLGLALWLASPRMFAMVLPRYVDPFGDHPPYTLTTFDVEVSPTPVYCGRPAVITARLGGPQRVERASVVFIDAPAGPPAAMFRRDESTFLLEIERAEVSRRFYINTPQGRSATFSLDVAESPLIEEVQVRYEYPAYTGWPPHQQLLSERGLRALAGTEVVLTVRSNVALQSGRIELHAASGPAGSGGPTVGRLAPGGDPKSVQGRIKLVHDGSFFLTLLGQSGGESLSPLTGNVSVLPDKPPRVLILDPPPQLVAVENFRVPVVAEGVDDVGIAKLRLSRSVNGWGPSSVELPLEELRPGVVRGQSEFDLKELGARAGDVITYYATAVDNHPAPPHFADSPLGVIQVISEEEYIQFARQQYQLDELAAELQAIRQDLEQLQKQREQLLEELEALRKQLAEHPDDPQLQERLRQAEEQLAKYGEQAAALADRLDQRAEQLQLYDLEQPYTEMLQRLSRELRQESQRSQSVAEALQQIREQGLTPERQQALADAAEQLQRDAGLAERQRELAEAQPDLELFQMADGMLQQVERLRSVIQQQRDLATRFAELQNRGSLSREDQHRADQLAKEQELVEQELREIARELQQAAETAGERLPQMSASAQQIARQIEELQISEDQLQAADRARRGAGREAHERADSAARKLESLAAECQNCRGAAGEMCQGLDGPLSLSLDALERSLDQLAQGRSIPGPSRPGRGSGPQGAGGTGASGYDGDSAGGEGMAPPYWRPGQSFPGSQARMRILGPRTLTDQQPQRQGGRLGANERGSFLPDVIRDPAGEAESLTPESRSARPSSTGNLRGVPVPYRRDAESYFRRLAEDEAAR